MNTWEILIWFLDWGWMVVTFAIVAGVAFVIVETISLYKEYKEMRKRNELKRTANRKRPMD
jgi:heme/copper-type cytochrome/quinol oxidase subunit 2